MTRPEGPAAVLDELASLIRAMPGPAWRGEVKSASGMLIRAGGLERRLSVGDRCDVGRPGGHTIPCEVVGVREDASLLMSFGTMEGVSVGLPVVFRETAFDVRPHEGWGGRVVHALGEPIDGKGPLPEGAFAAPLRNTPPPAVDRRRVGPMLETGVKVIDAFTPICRGQRMGIFAGSGVGKSTLLSMLARSSEAEVNVIGLIGERGREVQEFIQRDLGEEGLSRSIVVVATSDESPLARRQAAFLTLAVAEDQRKRGRQVFCMIDSVTRFAHALREIGLAVGEPPSARGYPPSVYAELARLLERAGPGTEGQGDITLAATVLVDGDDHDEPIGDAVRGILDGHIVLDRRIAMRGRFPAVNVPGSVSRLAPDCYPDDLSAQAAMVARGLFSVFEEKQDIIQIGLYKTGTDETTDRALALLPALETFFKQARDEAVPAAETFEKLARLTRIAAAQTKAPPAPQSSLAKAG
jgi:flagellum-specific ATP synthase